MQKPTEKFEEEGKFYYRENKEFSEMNKREVRSRLEISKLKTKIKNLKSDLVMQKKVNAGWYGKDQKYIVEEIQYQNNIYLKNDKEMKEALKMKNLEFEELRRKYENLSKFKNENNEVSFEVFEKKNKDLDLEKARLEKEKSDYKMRITDFVANEYDKRELEYKNQILNLELEKKNVDPKKVEKLKKKIYDRNFKIDLLENEIQNVRDQMNFANNNGKECMECHLDAKKRIEELHKLNKMYRDNLMEKEEDLLFSKNNLKQTRDHLKFMETQILDLKKEIDTNKIRFNTLKKENFKNENLINFYKNNNSNISSYDEKLNSAVKNLEKENENLKNLINYHKSKSNTNHYNDIKIQNLLQNLKKENEHLKSSLKKNSESSKNMLKTLKKENEDLKKIVDSYRNSKNDILSENTRNSNKNNLFNNLTNKNKNKTFFPKRGENFNSLNEDGNFSESRHGRKDTFNDEIRRFGGTNKKSFMTNEGERVFMDRDFKGKEGYRKANFNKVYEKDGRNERETYA